MVEDNKKEATLQSPNDLLAAGKDIMLEGKDPETENDWLMLVNFWAANIHSEVQPVAIQLMCKIYDAPVTDYQVEAICQYQAECKT